MKDRRSFLKTAGAVTVAALVSRHPLASAVKGDYDWLFTSIPAVCRSNFRPLSRSFGASILTDLEKAGVARILSIPRLRAPDSRLSLRRWPAFAESSIAGQRRTTTHVPLGYSNRAEQDSFSRQSGAPIPSRLHSSFTSTCRKCTAPCWACFAKTSSSQFRH